MPSVERPTSRLKGIAEDDTILIKKSRETHKRLSNLEELDEIYKAIKIMKLKAEDRNNLAARLIKVIEKMKSE